MRREIGILMHVAWQLWRERGGDALWERILGFLDWDAERMVEEQRGLLERQLQAHAASPLMREITGGAALATVEDLRGHVPLTDYDAYVDTLGERRDDALAVRPDRWMKTSGRADGGTKWIPLSPAAREELAWATLGLFIAARAREKGDIRLPEELRLLNMTAPPPYFSGNAIAAYDEFHLWRTQLFPRNEPTIDALPFEERMALGFAGAARRGVDLAVSYSSVLAGVSRSISRRRLSTGSRSDLRQRARLWQRQFRAWIEHRGLLPRDVWSPKAIVAGGMDAALFRGQIIEEWGCDPLELFGSTDGLFLGMQTWDRTTTTLLPQFNFFEFIPQAELVAEEEDAGHEPRTVLLDELSESGSYELVVTSLLDGALVRYRTGEILRLAATSNASAGVRLPQFVYQGQRSDLVEVAGFARLSEQTFARALANAGVVDLDWTVRKEVQDGAPIVHLRLELATPRTAEDLAPQLNEALRLLDVDWRDMEDFADIHPLRVTVVSPGTFAHWRAMAAGRNLSHINANDAAIDLLVQAERELLAAGS